MDTTQKGYDEQVLRAAWDGRADLHEEFGDFETFAAFEGAVAKGDTKLPSAMTRRASRLHAEATEAKPPAHVDEARLRALWDASAELRAEFVHFEQLLSYERACARGQSREPSVLANRL